jgi:4-hydroxy-3-methylbut-2-enyl diphosphate reductase
VYEKAREFNMEIIDATCPFVKKIHKIVSGESLAGKQILIIGDEKHPEVIGIRGWSESCAMVIGTREEAEKFQAKMEKPLCIVAQTTFNGNKFKDIVEIIRKKGYDILDLNTICDATNNRQQEARDLSARVDKMIVIGDKKSSNTQNYTKYVKRIVKILTIYRH